VAYGRYFEELEVGQEFQHWPGRTIQEYDDTLLSLLSMNQHPVHHDAHYAQGGQHGRRLVAGPVVISLAIGLSQADIGGRALSTRRYLDVRHESPTFHGDTIYADSRVLGMTPVSADRGEVEIETWARNQRGETILSMRRVIVVPIRGGIK
jgi:acyl dehydratase